MDVVEETAEGKEAFSDLNHHGSGLRMSEYTAVKQQTRVLDKFNRLTEKYNQAGVFIKPTSKLSCEAPEPRQSRRGETRRE